MAGRNGTARKLFIKPEAIDIEDLTGDDVFVTQKGFKLRVLPVSPDLMDEARARIPRPEPPLRDDPEKPGQVFMVMNDPKYQKEMDEYNKVEKQLTFNIAIAYGIAAYSVPEGYYQPEEDGWVELLQDDDVFTVNGKSYAIDMPPADKPRARFAAWLRYYVLTNEDAITLVDALIRGSGKVMEKDVEEALDSFPGREGRPAAS